MYIKLSSLMTKCVLIMELKLIPILLIFENFCLVVFPLLPCFIIQFKIVKKKKNHKSDNIYYVILKAELHFRSYFYLYT